MHESTFIYLWCSVNLKSKIFPFRLPVYSVAGTIILVHLFTLLSCTELIKLEIYSPNRSTCPWAKINILSKYTVLRKPKLKMSQNSVLVGRTVY
jgi:hypothetical protein